MTKHLTQDQKSEIVIRYQTGENTSDLAKSFGVIRRTIYNVLRHNYIQTRHQKEYKKSIQERFWEKVKIGNSEECWEWQAHKDKDGYGGFRLGNTEIHSHRMSWMFLHGDISNGMCILHKCDNPGCVNPNHLYIGTNQDNIDDKVRKGRTNGAKGERQGSSKLSTKDVIEIRKLYSGGEFTQRQIAHQYNVSESEISHIVHNKRWKHLS